MKILQISQFDHAGGAERVAYDLHQASFAAGFISHMLVGWKRTDDTNISELVPRCFPDRFFYRCLNIFERYSGFQAYAYWMANSWLRKKTNNFDIIHLHNLHGKYFNLSLLPLITKKSRIIITLHDCWLFTGHCAHPLNCERWQSGCFPCKDILLYPKMGRDAASYNLKRKIRLMKETKPIVITPSRWLADLVRKSKVFENIECSVIFNGVDTKRFCPGDKNAIRNSLGLPVNKKIILYVANGGLNSAHHKDPLLLLSAIERLQSGPIAGQLILVVIGGKKEISPIFANCVVQIEDTREGLEAYYQAADILVYPTKADNCPLVPIEAMSCGLPVVSTRVGGVAEIVNHGETGYVVLPGDDFAFSQAIEKVITSPTLAASMHDAAIQRARTEFSSESMISKYIELYQSLL